MTPREQGNLESDGQVSKEDCTHFYRQLTCCENFNVEGAPCKRDGIIAGGWSCSNPNCNKYFPMDPPKDPPYEKHLDITNVKEARDKIEDLKVFGDGDTWVLLCKASSKRQGWMKSTKVMNVPGGCVVQVTTQEQSHIAEAVTYVPGVQITGNDELRILAAIPINERGGSTTGGWKKCGCPPVGKEHATNVGNVS